MRHGNYIPDDGYTEPGYIEAVPRLFDMPLRFTYRPCLPEERARHMDATSGMNGEKLARAGAGFVASRLKTWDHKDQAGETLPITAVNVGRLKPGLSNRLYGIVLGVDPSDLDPEWNDGQKADAVDTEYESALFGQPVGDVRQEGSEKNSAPG